MKKIILASALSSALLLSGCGGGDDAAQVIADEFISISGKISNLSDTGESDVGVEGVYSSPGGLLNPATTTDSSGNFSLQVLKNDAVFLRATKDSFATINSAKAPLSANVSGLDIDMPTKTQAQDVINLVFTGTTPNLADKAWLAVDVVFAADGDELAGEIITPATTPATEAYPDCEGAPGASPTVAGCTDRPSPMYMAYYDADTETAVTVGSETQTAVLRKGEIAVLEFEVLGSFAAGQLKYDADCASCHAAGTHDLVGEDSDLYNDGDKLIVNISSYSRKKSEVADLTAQEILDLTAFLDDPSIAP